MAKNVRKPASKSKVTEEEIRTAVRSRYTKLALKETSCCGSSPSTMCSCSNLYPSAEVLSLPADAIAVSAGCGNPTAIADLKEGMTVVDLGSGGGIDVFLAAKKVGPKGRAIGIDATPEMILRARRTAKESGFGNVEFRLGEIEHMPLDANTADIVISNCVINLAPDKEQVFREAFRVLKPGGKLAVSDIVLLGELPEEVKGNMSAWSSCVAGAVSEDEYTGAMRRAGFTKVVIEDRVVYTHEQVGAYIGDQEAPAAFTGTQSKLPSERKAVDLSGLIASYRITAVKPKR
jgi:SAM-dependent methyltransferase